MLWIQSAGPGLARLGVDEQFLETFDEEIVGLELAPAGTRLRRGEAFGFLHAATRTFDLRAALGLEIVEVNALALADPRRVRESPYGEGWLILARPLD
jgi:glycine cleavage system H lipoate-binding protein